MALDLTGQRFGRLVALQDTGKRMEPSHLHIWLCKCDCGNYTEVNVGDLRNGTTKSCGCWRKERAGNLNRTHGGRHERLYLVWMDMRRRCRDKKDVQYMNYGGRGIKVCDEWSDYAAFREWALQTGYDSSAKSRRCTIDRIDSDGDYCPENCRWADSITQNNNRRNNVFYTLNGKTMTAAMWARENGISNNAIYKRIKAGWSLERALTEKTRPIQRHRKAVVEDKA